MNGQVENENKKSETLGQMNFGQERGKWYKAIFSYCGNGYLTSLTSIALL